MSLPLFFQNFFHNFKILLKKIDFQPYLLHKAQSYINDVNVVHHKAQTQAK